MTAVRRAQAADAAAIAEVYLASFRAALPTVKLAHADREVHAWMRERVVAHMDTWVAVDGARIVGMLVLAPGWIEQLYVAPDRLGEGIGHRLLEHAKAHATGALSLWTFQVNERARRFYERNGFVAVEWTDGATNDEHEPDVRYRWEPATDAGQTR